MNSLPIYHILASILKSLPVSIKLERVTRLFTLGILAASSCHLLEVARSLSPFGSLDGQYRRLQRFLANPRLERFALQKAWAGWVLGRFASARSRLLIDETKLSTNLSVMVVGLLVEGGCIPIAWRCYHAKNYPKECSFRDLKSDGFSWDKSHVWLPNHAERLILVLVMAYTLVLSLGMDVARPKRGRATRYSIFRLGLERLKSLVHPTILPLLPYPPPKSITCVVQ